jgi:hypothetical protein
MEGHTKAGRTTVRVRKQHADEKVTENISNIHLVGVVMHCNRVLGWIK